MKGSGLFLRECALGFAIVTNVIWSYCVMHLGRYAVDLPMDPIICVALPCYLGYVLGALVVLFYTRRTGNLPVPNKMSWSVALALLMSFVAVLLAFAPIQTAFSTAAFVAFANLFSGCVCSIYKAATYIPPIMLMRRWLFIGFVLVAHSVVYILSVVFANLHYSTVMLLIVFVLPILLVMLLRKGSGELDQACRTPQINWLVTDETAATHIDKRAAFWSALVATLCAAALCTFCDYSTGSSGWIVSITDDTPSTPMNVLIACVLVGCGLTMAASLPARHFSYPICHQFAFVVMLVALIVSIVSNGLLDSESATWLQLPSIFPRSMFWVLTYDLVYLRLMAPAQSYAWHIIVLHLLNLLGSIAAAAGMNRWFMLFLYAVGLLATASAPLMWRNSYTVASDPATQQYSEDSSAPLVNAANLLQRDLGGLCHMLGEKYGLSDREEEILVLLSQGRSRKYICEACSLSEGTVRSHTTHIYTKMGIHSSNELADILFGCNTRF